MKRRDLVRHLEAHGCQLLRQGSRHSVYVHLQTGRVSTVPRDREVNGYFARKIRRDLDVTTPVAR